MKVIARIYKFLKENKKAFLITLVGGIIIYYHQAMLNWLGDVTVGTLVLISDNFSLRFYEQMAKNDPYFIVSLNFAILFMIALMGVFLYARREYLRIMEWEINSWNELPEKEAAEIQRPKIPFSRARNSGSLKKDILLARKIKKVYVVVSIWNIVFLLYLFSAVLISVQANKANVNFRNDLTKLSVFLDAKQITRLKAEWVQMKSKDDFDNIQGKLQSYFEKFNMPH